MRGSLELLPFADDDESDECSDEGLESSEATASLKSETMHRVFFLPRALHLKGKSVKSEKDNCSLEACHDREARKMAGQRMVRKNKVPMATASRGCQRSEFTQHVGHLSATRKLERNLR